MKAFINVMLGIVVLALIAAVVLFVMTMGGGDESTTSEGDGPAADEVVRMSTGGVVDNIERRLEAKIGSALTARCPAKVDQAIGTTFRCSVRREGRTERIALAYVTIDGPGGEFSWTSSSTSLRTPTPTPTEASVS